MERRGKNYKFKIFSLQKEVSGHENPALIHREVFIKKIRGKERERERERERDKNN